MKTLIFLCLSLSSYAQVTITNYNNKLIENYSIYKVVDNQFQQSYRITNIYDLSTKQIDITKVNKTYNINLYDTFNNSKKRNNSSELYSRVRSGFERKSKKKEDEFDY